MPADNDGAIWVTKPATFAFEPDGTIKCVVLGEGTKIVLCAELDTLLGTVANAARAVARRPNVIPFRRTSRH